MPENISFTTLRKSLFYKDKIAICDKKPLPTGFPGRLKDMIKERRVWMTIRKLEKKEKRETNVRIPTISKEAIAASLLHKHLFWGIKNDTALERTLYQLQLVHFISPLDIANQSGYCTEPIADDYFNAAFFWPKLVDEFGFWKFIGAITAVTILLTAWHPDSFAQQLLGVIKDIIHVLHT